jgi:hypothetical protein
MALVAGFYPARHSAVRPIAARGASICGTVAGAGPQSAARLTWTSA